MVAAPSGLGWVVDTIAPTTSKREGLAPLGIFAICLGLAAAGMGVFGYGVARFERAMFSRIGELDPSFPEAQLAGMLDFFGAFERVALIHLPILAVGGMALLVSGVLMRRPDRARARKAALLTTVVAGLGVVEVAAYLYGMQSLMWRMPGMSEMGSADMPFDMDSWMRMSAVMNFVFMAAPTGLLAFLTGRELRRTR